MSMSMSMSIRTSRGIVFVGMSVLGIWSVARIVMYVFWAPCFASAFFRDLILLPLWLRFSLTGVLDTVRARMVPFRVRGSQRAAGADDEVVLSGVSEAVGGWGEGAGAWCGRGWWVERREEAVCGGGG